MSLCLKSELDYFFIPPTQTAIESANYVTYSLVKNYLTGDENTWEVASTPNEAVDLAYSSLLSDVCIRTGFNGNPGRNASFVPVNMFFGSLFSGHELLPNNEPVSTIPALPHYGAFIETSLNYGTEANEQLLMRGGF